MWLTKLASRSTENVQATFEIIKCDKLTKQMSDLKGEKRQFEAELTALTRKQRKSIWYHQKKTSHSLNADNSEVISQVLNSPTSTPSRSYFVSPPVRTFMAPRRSVSSPLSPQSDIPSLQSSSCTPSPTSSHRLTSPPTSTFVPRPRVTPGDRFSSPLPPQTGSESECTHDSDTVIVSSDEADFSPLVDQPSLTSDPQHFHPPSLRRCARILHDECVEPAATSALLLRPPQPTLLGRTKEDV